MPQEGNQLIIVSSHTFSFRDASLIPSREEMRNVFEKNGIDVLSDETFKSESWQPSTQCRFDMPSIREIQLVICTHDLTREECIQELKRHQLRPALPSEALAFAQADDAHGARSAMIVILGADIIHDCGIFVSWLYACSRHTYRFGLIGFQKPFHAKTHYLAVKSG